MKNCAERATRALLAATCVALAAATLVAAEDGATEDPLAGLEVSADGVGWDGIRLGMSLVQAERRFGVTLALDGRPKARCAQFVAGAERGGLNLSVGFPSAKPGAKIDTIFVQFEGYQVAANSQALIASLKRKIPTAKYLPDPTMPERTEAEDLSPKYAVDGKVPAVIHLRVRDGVMITRPECLP